MRSNSARMPATSSMKSASREPMSRCIAAFTVALVVSGPGVKRSGFFILPSSSGILKNVLLLGAVARWDGRASLASQVVSARAIRKVQVGDVADEQPRESPPGDPLQKPNGN